MTLYGFYIILWWCSIIFMVFIWFYDGFLSILYANGESETVAVKNIENLDIDTKEDLDYARFIYNYIKRWILICLKNCLLIMKNKKFQI